MYLLVIKVCCSYMCWCGVHLWKSWWPSPTKKGIWKLL